MFQDVKQRFEIQPQLSQIDMLHHGRAVLQLEADALHHFANTLDDSFASAIDILLGTQGRIVVSGIGKSGHIARKMAATFSSTGLPSFFVHPGEAAHGDLGMITSADVIVALSNSGATPELLPLMQHARALGCPVIGITSQGHSPMTKVATLCILLPRAAEACAVNISPTTSTTLMLALGDALAVTVMKAQGISRSQLELLHPGGAIGSRLLPVRQIMHSGDRLPLVLREASMQDVLMIMTEKSFGIAGVIDDAGRLLGTITDGDLRRNIDGLLARKACDVMTGEPKTISDGMSAEDALAILAVNRITALFVMDPAIRMRPIGLIHIHDLDRLGVS